MTSQVCFWAQAPTTLSVATVSVCVWELKKSLHQKRLTTSRVLLHMKINNPASYQFSHAKLTVFRVFFLSCFCTATVSRDCCFYTPHTHAGHTKMFGCFPAGDGLTVACHVNRLDVFKDWGPPNCSFSPQNSTRCLMKASVCVRMVCVCVLYECVCVCVIIFTCVLIQPLVWRLMDAG